MADEHALDEGMIDLAEELEAAGLITTGVDAEGNETWCSHHWVRGSRPS